MNNNKKIKISIIIMILAIIPFVVLFGDNVNDTSIKGLDFIALQNMERGEGGVLIPDFYYEGVDILPLSYSNNVKTLDDFYEWKNGSLLNGYRALPTTNDVGFDGIKLIESNDIFNKYTIPYAFDPEIITVYEALPENSNNKAVLVIPGTGNTGVRDVLNLPSDIEHRYYQNNMIAPLLDQGYTVYTSELRGFGERVIDVGGACNNKSVADQILTCQAFVLTNALNFIGVDINNIRTNELTQVLSYIDSKNYDKIAVIGLSLGGGLAQSVTIVNHDVVDAVVVASGTGSTFNGPISQQTTGNGQLLCCDGNDKTATIAPIPMYVSFGIEETNMFGWEAETGHTGAFLKEVYKLHGVEDSFYYHTGDASHQYYSESIIEFLEKVL